MKKRIAITGFGLSIGGYRDEEHFFSDYFSGDKIEPRFSAFEKSTQLDEVTERYLGYTLGKKLLLNRFEAVKVRDRHIRVSSQEAYHVCLATKAALKRSNLLRNRTLSREKIAIVHNMMYPSFKPYGAHLPLKSHWEQQSVNYLGHTFNIRGPQWVYREGQNADLVSIALFLNMIDKEKMPVLLVGGLSLPHPMLTRVEVLEALKPLYRHIQVGQAYIVPTKYSDVALSVVFEDYAHARQRGAGIYAEIDAAGLGTYETRPLNRDALTESIFRCIRESDCPQTEAWADGPRSTRTKKVEAVFGSFNRDFITDACEFNAIKAHFPEAAVFCSRKLLGRCAPVSGLLALVLILSGFENNRFPQPAETLQDVLNEGCVKTDPLDVRVDCIMLHSLSMTGGYANLVVSRG